MSNCLRARDPVLTVIRDSCHKHTTGGRSWCVAFEEEPDSSHRWTSTLSASWQLLCLDPLFWNCMAIICNYSMVHCQIWYLKKVICYLNLPIIAENVFKGRIGCSLNKKGQSLILESGTVYFSMVQMCWTVEFMLSDFCLQKEITYEIGDQSSLWFVLLFSPKHKTYHIYF